MAILGWRPDAASSDGPPPHHCLSPATITEALQAAGFEVLPPRGQHEDGYLGEARVGEVGVEQSLG